MPSPDPARRQQILDAAARLLVHYGPHKTTIAEIAREAEVGVGSVYLEFESKEAILEELSSRRHMRVFQAMQEAAVRGGRDYASRICAVLDARVQGFLGSCDEGAHARDLLHCVSPAVKSAHERFRAEEEALLAQLLREGARAGELDVPRPAETAVLVLRAYASFSPPWIFSEPRAEVERALGGLHRVVLRGLLRRPVGRGRSSS